MLIEKLSLLQVGGEYPKGLWHSNWEVEPRSLFIGFLLIAGYLALIGPINERRPGHEQRTVAPKQVWFFISGVAIMTIVMGPPFNDWADNFLFSVQMFQHLTLLLVVAPLLLKGIPGWFFNPITRRPWLDRIGRSVTRPVATFVVSNALLVLWHLPALYNAAFESPPIHAVQHSALLLAGVFVWWPIIAPNPNWPKVSSMVAMLLLLVQTLPGGIVGATIRSASPDAYGSTSTAPRLWGISPSIDVQMAGLMMSLMITVVYLLVLTVIYLRWASREEAKDRGASVPRAGSGPDTASIS